MRILFFEKEGYINQKAIYAGVYHFQIGLIDDDEKNYLSLYVGESYSMLKRCSEHIYDLFKNPSYFGLTKDDIENNRLQLIVRIHKQVSFSNSISNKERDIILRQEEAKAIKELTPLSQNSENDNLKKNRIKVVQEAISKLLSNR